MPLGSYTSAAFTTAAGVAVAATADVEVRRESDGALADLKSDRAGATPIAQPGFQADSTGRFIFYAAGISGGYQVKVTKGAETHTARYQATGTAREFDASTYGAGLMNAADAPAARVLLEVFAKDEARTLLASAATIVNGYLAWSVAGNVLTVAVKTLEGEDPSSADPVAIIFRSATATDGLPVVRQLTAATSIAINDTALLGTINSTAFRLWCVAFDDGGTVRLALINCLASTNIFPLAGWGIASSTLEDNASDSAHVFYSAGAAVAAKAYATLGYATWEAGLATAGTWSAGPTRAQMFGPGVPLPGQTVQTQRNDTGATATGTTAIPLDDTIPQNTEGDQYMTQAITPTSAANLLGISHLGMYSSTADSVMTVALFQDLTVGALKAGTQFNVGTDSLYQNLINHSMLAGTTSVTTFKIRAGSEGAGTTRFNGRAGARLLGGVANSFLQATEVMA